jgi:hypothetical protein
LGSSSMISIFTVGVLFSSVHRLTLASPKITNL